MTWLWVVCALALAGAVLVGPVSSTRGSSVGPGPPRPGPPGPGLPGPPGSGSPGPLGSGSPGPLGPGAAGGSGGLTPGAATFPAVLMAGLRSRWRRTGRAPAGHLGSYVLLVAAALRGGSPTSSALGVAATALPGEAATRVGPHLARLRVGADPAQVWSELARDDLLGPLGRVLARAHRTGAPVADQVMRLADELAERDRADAIDAARRVGVKAALPLGLCLLPSFLLLGIVPMAAGLLATVLT